MATVVMGSARHDEFGKYLGGKLGDQLQMKTDDFSGEVSMQYLNAFAKNRKWYIIRLKQAKFAQAIAQAMLTACNNKNDGYDQGNRLAVVTDGIDSKIPTEGDCGTYVRACFIAATGKDPGNFTTDNEIKALEKTGLVDKAITYHPGLTNVYEGDIFVTQTKGHTGICIKGNKRAVDTPIKFNYQGVDYSRVFDPEYYAKYNPDVVNALGDDPIRLFNHFIVFGCNEKSRIGKTISDFNVEVYSSHGLDLLDAFGPFEIQDPLHCNGFPFYRHYCQYGYKESRRTI